MTAIPADVDLTLLGRPSCRGAAGESFVIRQDWQHQAVIGPLLRWLGPRLP